MQDALDPIVEDAQLEAAVQEQIANAQAVIGACMELVDPEEMHVMCGACLLREKC